MHIIQGYIWLFGFKQLLWVFFYFYRYPRQFSVYKMIFMILPADAVEIKPNTTIDFRQKTMCFLYDKSL